MCSKLINDQILQMALLDWLGNSGKDRACFDGRQQLNETNSSQHKSDVAQCHNNRLHFTNSLLGRRSTEQNREIKRRWFKSHPPHDKPDIPPVWHNFSRRLSILERLANWSGNNDSCVNPGWCHCVSPDAGHRTNGVGGRYYFKTTNLWVYTKWLRNYIQGGQNWQIPWVP